MRDFHKYKVWEKGHKLSVSIYNVTKSFPKEESFGLTSQIRRASMSIPINIAEGCGRKHDTEFSQFLNIAAGSASEVEEELLLSYDLEYIDKETFQKLDSEIKEIRSMIRKLMVSLKAGKAD